MEEKNTGDMQDGIFKKLTGNIRERIVAYRALTPEDKRRAIKNMLLSRAMYIIIIAAIAIIAIAEPRFLSIASIINIISLTAAKLPIALGIGGAIVLTGTDISAGRAVGLTACIAASLLQSSGYSGKMFPNLSTVSPLIALLAVMCVGALIGLLNGFFVSRFKLHPFIV